MSPLVVFVAVNVLIVVSMSAEPLPPMPVAAVSVVWPVVTRLGSASLPVSLSVIAPVVAVSVSAPENELT